MFFFKKIKKLESHVDSLCKELFRLKETVPDLVTCGYCKCLGDRNDFKEVIIQYKRYYSLYYTEDGNGESKVYYCQKCKPNYDYVDKTEEKPVYYKTVEEHKVKVK